MSDETHPDRGISGQPYSAPRQAWGGNADPRNLSYEPEGLRYFGPGYQQPNDVPWDGRPPQSYLPPPEWKPTGEPGEYTADIPPIERPGIYHFDTRPPPADTGWLESAERRPRSWFAQLKFWTGRTR